MNNIQKVAKSEYQRRELYNVFYALNENTRDAEYILNTCKPCKKKAQEAGLSTDEVEPEKMDLLIKGFQCYINAIDEAKKQVEALGYGVDSEFDLNAYKDECQAYYENQQKIAMDEQEKQMNEQSEWQKKLNEIIQKYNELMNDEIQRVKKEMGV